MLYKHCVLSCVTAHMLKGRKMRARRGAGIKDSALVSQATTRSLRPEEDICVHVCVCIHTYMHT